MRVQNIKRSSIWKIRLSTATMTLIPAAVGINYVAKAFAEGLKLPVWLGTLGTFLASMLAGPVAGAISGFINNVIYGLTLSPVSTVYAITSIGIGIAVGVLHAKGWFSSAKKVFVSAIIIAIVSAVISTPLNVIFWGGQTGIPWGDSIFAAMIANHIPVWISSFTDEFILDISKAGKSAVHAIEFSSFLIFTMLIIQGLFYSHNQTLLVSVVGIRFYQEGLLYAATMGCRIFVIILATSFFMTTTTVSENSKYLEQVGLSYKAVYILMSVCYILPEMMANMKKIQMAQRARGINQQKTILEKIKSILPVLVPLVIKTLDQSMERSIALRLRGFNSPHRVALKSANLYRHEMVNHRGLSLLAIILIEWKLWIIGSKFI